MVSFENDYNHGAHPKVLEALTAANPEAFSGYGCDPATEDAARKIKEAFGCPEASVRFLVGGTQTNALVIRAILREYEGVVAADTGHIAVHEAGAVEATGHKVLVLPGEDGKLRADTLAEYLEGFYADGNREHMVSPGMVYISFPTETGSLYSREELSALHEVCARYGLPLFADGARLAYGLMSPQNDVTPEELSRLCNVFTVGGTKCGTLFGEAVVFPQGKEPDHFTTVIKRHGALLAKGWLMGLMFGTLFTDGLYFTIGRETARRTERLKTILREAGIPEAFPSPTNQQYVLLENETIAALSESVRMSFWENRDAKHTVMRLVVGWATTDEDLAALKTALETLKSRENP